MEFFILGALDWKLNKLTASDIIRFLVEITQFKGNQDLFLRQCDNFSALCYSDYQLSKLGAITIAICSACCVFEHFRQI